MQVMHIMHLEYAHNIGIVAVWIYIGKCLSIKLLQWLLCLYMFGNSSSNSN